MIESKNSCIFNNVYEKDYVDFSHIGNDNFPCSTIINKPGHSFRTGDAIYFDLNDNTYYKALAINRSCCEVIGLVGKITHDTFELVTNGVITLDRYKDIKNDSPLYLSPVYAGQLTSDKPTLVKVCVGYKINNGVHIDIEKGIFDSKHIDSETNIKYRYYESQEIQDIIDEVKGALYG